MRRTALVLSLFAWPLWVSAEIPAWKAYSAQVARANEGPSLVAALEAFDDPAGPRQVQTAKSSDGETWSAPVRLETGPGTAGSPWLCESATGPLLFLHRQTRPEVPYRMVWARLDSSGQWSGLNSVDLPETGAHTINPSVTILPSGEWILTYQEWGAGSSKVRVTHSSDQGASWTSPLTVASGRTLPRVHLTPRGNLLLVCQGRLSTGAFELFGATSTDGGVSWTPPRQLTAEWNCHDASFLNLPSGATRLFYISTLGGAGQYEVVSRDLTAQSISDQTRWTHTVGGEHQPHAVRLSDGASLLVWGEASPAGTMRIRSKRTPGH